MKSANCVEVDEAMFPVVFCDHDGFAAGIEAEGPPTRYWPSTVPATEEWSEIIRMAGPPLYGQQITVSVPRELDFGV